LTRSGRTSVGVGQRGLGAGQVSSSRLPSQPRRLPGGTRPTSPSRRRAARRTARPGRAKATPVRPAVRARGVVPGKGRPSTSPCGLCGSSRVFRTSGRVTRPQSRRGPADGCPSSTVRSPPGRNRPPPPSARCRRRPGTVPGRPDRFPGDRPDRPRAASPPVQRQNRVPARRRPIIGPPGSQDSVVPAAFLPLFARAAVAPERCVSTGRIGGTCLIPRLLPTHSHRHLFIVHGTETGRPSLPKSLESTAFLRAHTKKYTNR
jgi:hypothetical protein